MENWWDSKKDAHEGVMEVHEAIRDDQSYRKEQNLQNLRLYGNFYSSGLSSSNYARSKSTSIRNRVTLNVIQSMCDTVTAKIAKNRPKATFLTSDGDYRMQRRAKLLGAFIL